MHTSSVVRLVLIDFGSSRWCSTKTVVWNSGPIDFASPEQISHRKVTTKADIWYLSSLLLSFIVEKH